MLALSESENPARCSHNYGWRLFLQELDMLTYGLTTENYRDCYFFVVQVLREPIVLLFYLKRELSSVAHNNYWSRLWVVFKLMQSVEHKHCSFAHSWLGLTKYVHTDQTLWNAFLLDLRRVFEAAVGDCFHQLRFQKEVFKASTVNACELKLLFSTNSGKGWFRLKISCSCRVE